MNDNTGKAQSQFISVECMNLDVMRMMPRHCFGGILVKFKTSVKPGNQGSLNTGGFRFQNVSDEWDNENVFTL